MLIKIPFVDLRIKLLGFPVFMLLVLSLFQYACNLTNQYSRTLERKLQNKGYEARTLTNDSMTIHFRVGGSGDPVLLIHGFGGDGKLTWSKQMKALINMYQVIVPDILWFGKSESTVKPSLRLQASAMHLLLDSLHKDRLHTCGISYGGFMAFEMFDQQPDRMKSLIIVDSPGPHYPDSAQQATAREFGVAKTKDLFVPNDRKELQRMLDACFARDRKWPGFIYKEIYNTYFQDHLGPRDSLLDELEHNRDNYSDVVDHTFPPALVIWGRSDRIFKLWAGKELANDINADLTIIEKSGHLPNFEQPKKFNEVLLEFLDSQ